MTDFKKIEKKWQKKWEQKRVFESNVDKRKKFFITFPYPYINGSAHIGHTFTFMRCDAYARFKRMNGFNVLFPQGFHATGEAFLGSIERLKLNDKVQINTFKSFGASDNDIEKFKKNPKFAAKFWMKRFIEDFKSSGASIDWRRTFVTTTMTPTYSRFIEWQYNALKKLGYVIQGTHPVVWCPKCKSPTGDHDRLEGEGESPVEYVLVKFNFGDAVLPAATLRPETVFGVTNMWLKPETEYVKAEVDGEKWIFSSEAAEKISDQLKKVKIIGKINSEELFGKKCINPLTNDKVPILPADFVNMDTGTGVVMSVPSHAPYDWVAIKELIDKNKLEKYGLNKNDLEPVSLIKTDELGESPAIDVTKNISSLNDVEKLEEATKLVYKVEFHKGVLNDKCGEFSGLKVSECKDKLVMNFIDKNISEIFWDSNRIVCRCTTKNHIKILENQWFLKYSDDKWKKKAKTCIHNMKIYPEEARINFLNTIDWLKDKACARKTGLGTPLPWDKEWIVETLSDSTIYMAYYTIANIINKNKIAASKLKDEVFDYIFLGKGDLKRATKNSGLSVKLLKKMKNEFEYFYPVDMRNSGKDNLQNHLTFYIFHHTALWPNTKWPKGIGINGWINIEGEKMSKSKGNIIPLKDLISNHGADMVRVNIIGAGEGIDDADWRVENLKGLRTRLEFIIETAKNIKKMPNKKKRNIDAYMENKMQYIIKNSTDNYEVLNFRSGMHHALFESTNALKWYMRRIGNIKNADKKTIVFFMNNLIKLLSPITPHLCEEVWNMMGNKNLIANEKWPIINKKLINKDAERNEDFVKNILNDIEEIKKISKIEKPRNIKIFVAEEWKFRLYNKILKSKNKSMNEITKEIMNSDMKKYGKATIMFIQNVYNKINEADEVNKSNQEKILEEVRDFIKKEVGCNVVIKDASNSKENKARISTPDKPGILLE